jgi:hypothetical protein
MQVKRRSSFAGGSGCTQQADCKQFPTARGLLLLSIPLHPNSNISKFMYDWIYLQQTMHIQKQATKDNSNRSTDNDIAISPKKNVDQSLLT